jgi:hypothetical protein
MIASEKTIALPVVSNFTHPGKNRFINPVGAGRLSGSVHDGKDAVRH